MGQIHEKGLRIRSKQCFSFGLKKIEVELVGRNRWRLMDRLALWALA